MRKHCPSILGLALLLGSCAGTPQGKSAGPVQAYPLDTCIVTDNKLGSMGDPLTKVYGSREVKFCCKPCVKKYEAAPEKYLKKLN